MKIKLHHILLWLAITITFLLVWNAASYSELEELQEEVNILRTKVQENRAGTQRLGKVVKKNKIYFFAPQFFYRKNCVAANTAKVQEWNLADIVLQNFGCKRLIFHDQAIILVHGGSG